MLSCPGWLQKGLLPISKNTKKYETNTTQKYKIRTAGFGKYNWLVLYFFLYFGSWFPKVNTGLALWLIFDFFFFFVFLKSLRSYLFCILYFRAIAFVFFFVFCILEQLHSYCFCIFFVFFFVKMQKNTKKIQIEYQRNTLCIFVFFFVFFHYVQKCNLYFCIFFVFFQSFTDCTLSFCIVAFFRHAVKEQNRESINVCCIFLLLIILPCSVLYFFFCNLELYFFLDFLMITGFTVCSRPGTTQI